MRVTIQASGDNRTYRYDEWIKAKPFVEYEIDMPGKAEYPVPCPACGRLTCGFWLCPHCGANLNS